MSDLWKSPSNELLVEPEVETAQIVVGSVVRISSQIAKVFHGILERFSSRAKHHGRLGNIGTGSDWMLHSTWSQVVASQECALCPA
jgi:hypothetical protein